jgi:hypothetical protein
MLRRRPINLNPCSSLLTLYRLFQRWSLVSVRASSASQWHTRTSHPCRICLVFLTRRRLYLAWAEALLSDRLRCFPNRLSQLARCA